MGNRRMNIIVGVTGLLGLFGLAALLLIFGYMPATFEQGYDVRVRLDSSGGLAPGSRVRMADVDIGRVNEVRLVDPTRPQQGVKVVIRVRHEFRIPEDVVVRVKATSPLGGSPMLDLSVSEIDPELDRFVAVDGTGRLSGRGAVGIQESLIEELSIAMTPVTDQFTVLVSKFATLSDEWSEVGRNLRMLTDARTPEEVDEQGATANLVSAVARLDQRLEEMGEVITGISGYVNDPEIREQFDAILESFASASSKFDGAAEGFEKLPERAERSLENLERQVEQLAVRYFAVADDLSRAVNAAGRLMDEAREGEGTLGLLVQNPALYRNLEDAAERAGLALDEFRQLMEKLKQEGIRIR